MTLEDVYLDLTNRGRGNLWLKFFCLSGSRKPVVVNGVRMLARYADKRNGWELCGDPDEEKDGDKLWPIKNDLVYIPLDAQLAKYIDRYPRFPHQ